MPTLQRAPTRDFRTPGIDGRRWSAYRPRADDIIIATFSKCGTTWMQRIVDLLVFQDAAPRPIMRMSPWLDARFFAPLADDIAILDAQSHRRFIKSHLPFDALPIYDTVKYIHVARDGRDAFMSWHNHQLGFSPQVKARISALAAEDPDLPPAPPPPAPPADPHLFFQDWIARAEAPAQNGPGVDLSFFDFENTWWAERRRKNLIFVHYNDLKTDLPGEMARIAAFLDIDVPQERLAQLADAARFETMQSDGEALLPGIEAAFDHGPRRFLNKGTNGRWKDALTEHDLARYAAVARRKLSPACAAWIEHGRLIAGEPRGLPD